MFLVVERDHGGLSYGGGSEPPSGSDSLGVSGERKPGKETARRVRDNITKTKKLEHSLEDLRSHLVDHSTIRSPRLFLPGGRLEVVDQPSYPPFAAEEVQRNNEPSSPVMEYHKVSGLSASGGIKSTS